MNHKRPGQPALPEAEKRSQPVTAVMAPAEAEAVRNMADNAGLSVSAFLRRLALAAIAASTTTTTAA